MNVEFAILLVIAVGVLFVQLERRGGKYSTMTGVVEDYWTEPRFATSYRGLDDRLPVAYVMVAGERRKVKLRQEMPRLYRGERVIVKTRQSFLRTHHFYVSGITQLAPAGA